MEELVFTKSAVLGLLTQIEELKDYEISLTSAGDELALTIGDSTYTINTSDAEDVAVEPEVVEEVAEISDEGYDAIDNIDIDDEYVEGGILKEIAKTLLVGGMIRLTDKLLDKDRK